MPGNLQQTSHRSRNFAGLIFGRTTHRKARWGFLRNFAVLSGGSITAQLFNLATMPLITRLYVPENFGELALFLAFFNVAIVASSLNYEYAIVSASDHREASQLTFCSFLLSLPTSAIAGFVLYALVHFGWFGYGSLPAYAAGLMIPALICAACFSTLRYWLLRQEHFGLISRGMVFQNGGRALVQTALGCLGPHTAGLLAGEVFGRCSGMGRMLRASWPALTRELAGSTFREVRRTLGKNQRFVLYSLPSSILDTLAASISFPLVVYFYGINTGGNWALVARALALPAVLITANVADAFHSKAALLLQKDPRALPGFVKRVAAVLLLVGAIPSVTLVLYGPQLFQWVFGAKWVEAGMMAAWAAPRFLAQFVVNPLSRLVLVVGRQELKFIYDVMTFAGTIVVFAVAHRQGWPVIRLVAALSALNSAAYAVFFILILNISSTRHQQSQVAVGDVP